MKFWKESTWFIIRNSFLIAAKQAEYFLSAKAVKVIKDFWWVYSCNSNEMASWKRKCIGEGDGMEKPVLALTWMAVGQMWNGDWLLPLSCLLPALPITLTGCLSPSPLWRYIGLKKTPNFVVPRVCDFAIMFSSLPCTRVHNFCTKVLIRYGFLHLPLLLCWAAQECAAHHK